jgi:hypothetical protein
MLAPMFQGNMKLYVTRAHARWCWRATVAPKGFHECASCEDELKAQKDLIIDWKV